MQVSRNGHGWKGQDVDAARTGRWESICADWWGRGFLLACFETLCASNRGGNEDGGARKLCLSRASFSIQQTLLIKLKRQVVFASTRSSIT